MSGMNDETPTIRPEALATGRILGGWAMVYGQIGADGIVLPTVDRELQTMEAAGQLDSCDWSAILKKGVGVINDEHKVDSAGKTQRVGMPLCVEYHDGTTERSQRDGKVGWWLWCRLFDANDPSSWEGLKDPPTPIELARADYHWKVAPLLLSAGRGAGFSVQGRQAMTDDKRSAIFAVVTEVALTEYPVNPDCTIEHVGPVMLPMAKGIVTADDVMRGSGSERNVGASDVEARGGESDLDAESPAVKRAIQLFRVYGAAALREVSDEVLYDVLRRVLAGKGEESHGERRQARADAGR